MSDSAGPHETVTSWRIGELERGFKDLRGELKEAVGTLGGGMTALQTQLISYQGNMGDKYVPRREFKELSDRVDKQGEQQSEWGWKIISGLLSASAVIIALIALIHPSAL